MSEKSSESDESNFAGMLDTKDDGTVPDETGSPADDESSVEERSVEQIIEGSNGGLLTALGMVYKLATESDLIEEMGGVDNVFLKNILQNSQKSKELEKKKYYAEVGGFFVVLVSLVATTAWFTHTGVISGQTFTLFIGSILGYLANARQSDD